MRKIRFLFLVIAPLFVLQTYAQHLNPVYKIGDTLSCGAIVFWVQNNDSNRSQHILVCPAADPSSTQIPWFNGSYITTNAETDILFDLPNAQKIINVQGLSGNYAALACKTYQPAVPCPDSSWYLPSKSELSYMYQNLAAKGMGNFAQEGYWTSVEQVKTTDSVLSRNARLSFIVDFYNGKSFPVDKANSYHVRPVLALYVPYQQ